MSVTILPGDSYILLLDTDQYAGNFERELTAWLTGTIGECGIGGLQAAQAITELPVADRKWFEAHVISRTHSDGCSRPTSIWTDPEGKYNSVAIFMDEDPPAQILSGMSVRAKSFPSNKFFTGTPKVLGMRLLRVQ